MRTEKFSFGEKLQQIRKKKNITQVQLAKTLNVSQGAITHWETNSTEPSLSMLCSIAVFFNVSLDALLGITLPNPTDEKNSLLFHFGKLNQDGQQKVLEYITDLIDSGKYEKTQGKVKELG